MASAHRRLACAMRLEDEKGAIRTTACFAAGGKQRGNKSRGGINWRTGIYQREGGVSEAVVGMRREARGMIWVRSDA